MWTASEGFATRTWGHYVETWVPLLEDPSARIILTHATRGSIQGRTTHILRELSLHHGLSEVTLLLACDAPHNARGYATETSVDKVKAIAEILAPLAGKLLAAAERTLVAGDFAWRVISRVSGALKERLDENRIVHPCRWRQVPLQRISTCLAGVLGARAPLEETLARYIVKAHRESLVQRWKRMTLLERIAHKQKLKAAYSALPKEEKQRRAAVVSEKYAALLEEEKQRRAAVVSEKYAALPEEEKQRRAAQRAEGYAALPEEEKQRRAAAVSERYAALPDEEKQRRAAVVSEKYAALPEEEKQRLASLSREKTKEHWSRLSYVERLRRMQAVSRNLQTQDGKQRWRAALRRARAAMKPEVKERVYRALRLGYRSKMTPSKQAEVGQKRKLAWTPEMKVQAAERERARYEMDPSRGKKLMERAREVKKENQEEISKKKLRTCVLKLLEKIRDRLRSDELSKADRRTLREQGEKYLALHDSGTLFLEASEVELLQKGVDYSRTSGATLKSQKLKARHETARASAPASDKKKRRRTPLHALETTS